MTFERQLSLGHRGERIIENVLLTRGAGVIRSYAYLSEGDDKAPRLHFLSGGYVLPDLDVCRESGRIWVEVKTLWAPARNRTFNCLVHGFKARLRSQYLEVQKRSGAPVWIVVLEVESGDVLLARLDSLPTIPCLCGVCRQHPSRPGRRCLIYFNRNKFSCIANVTATAEFNSLKSEWREAA